jgi:hypothetical protein
VKHVQTATGASGVSAPPRREVAATDGRRSRWTEHRRARREELIAAIAAFVALIEEEPALYRFAYAHAGRSGRKDLVAATEREIAEALGVLVGERLADAGRPAVPALTWAYGIVGMVQLTAHWWSGTRSVPAADLVEQLTELAWGGLGTLLPPRRGAQ